MVSCLRKDPKNEMQALMDAGFHLESIAYVLYLGTGRNVSNETAPYAATLYHRTLKGQNLPERH